MKVLDESEIMGQARCRRVPVSAFSNVAVVILTTSIWYLLFINNQDLKNLSKWIGIFGTTFVFM